MDCGTERVLPHGAKGTEERSRESQMEEFSRWPKGADTGLDTTAWEQINEHGGINRCRLLRRFLCFFPQTLAAHLTHARAQIVTKKQVDPSWEIRSHLVFWGEGSICIIVNVWRARKCKKFACKWILQAEPMHQNTATRADKSQISALTMERSVT